MLNSVRDFKAAKTQKRYLFGSQCISWFNFKVRLIVSKASYGLRPKKKKKDLDSRSSFYVIYFCPIGPHVRTKFFGEVAFCYSGPRLWDNLPGSLRAAETVSGCKKELKTHLFIVAFV